MALQFRLFGFPVAIQPFFFLTAWLIGPHDDIQASALWIGSVFVGVLAHELGHATAGRRFGFSPTIILHGFGGATSWRGGRQLSHGRRIFLSAAGPAVGISIGLAAVVVGRMLGPEQGTALARLLTYSIWVNLGWGVLNLAPVLPLDGGHIAATAAEAVFGRRGRVIALGLSLLITVGLALWAIWNSEIWLTILAVILSVTNLQAFGPLRKRRAVRDSPTPGVSAPGHDALRAYDVARSMAASGQHGEALDWLETAIRSGFRHGSAIDADPVWAPVRNDPRFIDLRRSLT